jgi:hypothetical protein
MSSEVHTMKQFLCDEPLSTKLTELDLTEESTHTHTHTSNTASHFLFYDRHCLLPDVRNALELALPLSF